MFGICFLWIIGYDERPVHLENKTISKNPMISEWSGTDIKPIRPQNLGTEIVFWFNIPWFNRYEKL